MEHSYAVYLGSQVIELAIHNQDRWPVEKKVIIMVIHLIVSHSEEDNGTHPILCYISGDITPPGHQHNMEQYLSVAMAAVIQQKC